MNKEVLLLTPPFTQLNTPYPATAYLKGFLQSQNIPSYQLDLGIEVILKLFSIQGLTSIFEGIDSSDSSLSENSIRMLALKDEYLATIDQVITFLQNNDTTLAYQISSRTFLPEAGRFFQTEDLDWAFGNMGIVDKAKHISTLYLEDIGDLIRETTDSHFGFSRYAERLARCANEFDAIEEELQKPLSLIDTITLDILEEKIAEYKPRLVALSVPFPGNLFSGLRCAQWLRANRPEIKIAMGGGFANTELRSISDPRVFEYFQYITLDDGELPLLQLTKKVKGECSNDDLCRTFLLENEAVKYINNTSLKPIPFHAIASPDYSDLPLRKYVSVIEVVNPMHRLWSDGRWNKLTIAHGCYWGRCTFCDTTLDYIRRFEPQTAKTICDKIETLIAQTGETGFHFVDEAAPPALLREVALELIRRNLKISWWGNIRFEKNFTADLCLLLKESGCIAISGGIEVASDRLLSIINKGVSIAQVAKVSQNFTEAGIMVHAYLMYGFPTQTDQETIDSLEIVRQLFMHGTVQSAFWHLFTMTAHSPIGKNPQQFHVSKKSETTGSFANNDIDHVDKSGAGHTRYSEGLGKALFNYMHDLCFDYPLSQWFDFKVPKTRVSPDYISSVIENNEHSFPAPRSKVIWLGNTPEIKYFTKKKKSKSYEMAELNFVTKQNELTISLDAESANWLIETLAAISVKNIGQKTYEDLSADYMEQTGKDFDLFFTGKAFQQLKKIGLLVL